MAKTDNIKVFNAGLKDFAERTIKPKIASVLREVADWMKAHISDSFAPTNIDDSEFGYTGNQKFPVYSGNLHDATGIGVYIDGALNSYLPTPVAKHRQHYNGETGISGNERLQQALTMAVSTFSQGLWIVLFSAVPYAYEVNIAGSPIGRGVGFFEELKAYIKNDVFLRLKPLAE